MLKLPNKALLYKDWKNSKWFILLMSFSLLLLYLYKFESFNFSITGDMIYIERRFLFLTVIFVNLVIMSAVLFYPDRKLSTYTFTASMPFNRCEIIRSKWIIGIYNIVVSYFFIFIMINVYLITNYSWKVYFLKGLLFVIVELLIVIFLFGIIMLIQSLNSLSYLGVAGTILFTAIPFSIFILFNTVLNLHYKNGRYFFPGFLNAFYNSSFFRWPVTAMFGLFDIKCLFNDVEIFHGGYIDPAVYLFYSPIKEISVILFIRIFSLLLLTVLFYMLSIKAYGKIQLEESVATISIMNLKTPYRIATLYYLGVTFYFIYSRIVTILIYKSNIEVYSIDKVILFCFVLPTLLFFFWNKVSKIYQSKNLFKVNKYYVMQK